MIKNLIGLLLVFNGIVLGFYVGGYLCFFNGMVNIIDQFKGDINSFIIAWNIIKILFASFIGVVSSLFGIVPGIVILKLNNDI